MDLCHGAPPIEVSNCFLTRCDFNGSTFTGEKIFVQLGVHCDQMLSCLDTSPCALVPTHIRNLVSDDTITLSQALEHIRSLHYDITDSNSIVDDVYKCWWSFHRAV